MLAWMVAMLVVGPADGEWLQWRAPASCPDATHVRESVAARLGREPNAGEIAVDAEVREHGAAGLTLTLRTTREGVADARELTSPTCGPLVDAAALIVAVTVDPVATVATMEAIRVAEEPPEAAVIEPFVPPPEPIPAAESSPPKIAEETASPDATRRDRRPTELLLGIMGGPEIGALPGVSGGPNVALALAWPRARLELAGFYLAPRRANTDDGDVRVMMGALAVRACGRLRTGRLEAPLCAGLELGVNRGDGRNVPRPRTAYGRWIAPAASAGLLGWVTPRVALGARVELAIPVDRTGFDVRDPGDPRPLHTPALVSARLWAGIEVKLWGRDGSGASRRDNP